MAEQNAPAQGNPQPSAAEAAPVPRPVPASAIPGAETNAVPLYSGAVSLWMAARTFIFGALLDLAAVALLVYWAAFAPGTMQGTAAMIAGFALLIASSIMMLYTVLSVRATRY